MIDMWWCVVVMVVMTSPQLCNANIERDAFEAALNQWSAVEERFYRRYKAGEPYPPSTPVTATTKVSGEVPKTTVATAETPTTKAPPTTSDQAAWLSWAKELADESDEELTNSHSPIPPPPTPVPVVVEDAPSALRGVERRRSFSEVCGEDASNLCSEANPFNATFCLVSKKDALSKDCRDYVTAKVNCYLSTAKLCAGASSHLKCLYQHRYSMTLPRMCTRTRFFEYVRSGLSFKDVLLDQEVA
jgi:hypothetical protein